MKSVILCVDDEPVILRSLELQLRCYFSDQYVLVFADTPREALLRLDEHAAQGHPIGLIISDWLMPQMTGDEFLIEVHKRFPQAATILLTGLADADAIERARDQANLFACLYKPWDADALIDTINRAMHRSNHFM